MTARLQKTVKLVCLKSAATLNSGGQTLTKPMLVGFGSASDLLAIAKAPAFSEEDTNLEIGEMLRRLPVTKWQRPLDTARIAQMSGFFSAEGHLMPNPVLLAANPDLAPLAVTQAGELITVQVTVTDRVKREGALWILDGQHRINALAESTQSSNPVPFVLLLDDGGRYSRSEFASIFAQVTTKAQPLEQPHHTWLEYSFELGEYEQPSGQPRRDAFEAVVWLGSAEFAHGTMTPNRFAGGIRFNPRYPDRTTRVGPDGLEAVFAFPAQEFAKIIYEHYYKKPPQTKLPPEHLAGQLALAYDALRTVIAPPQHEAAFFKRGNLFIQEGFIVGVLAYLRTRGIPSQSDWVSVLRRLGVDRGSWEFRGRPIETGGQHGRPSRDAALSAFQHVFGQDQLPAGSSDLVSYVLGDTSTSVRLVFEDTAIPGTPIDEFTIVNQATLPLSGVLQAGRSLRIEISPNIGLLRLTASTRNPAYWTTMSRAVRTKRGFELDELAGDLSAQGQSGAITLEIWFELYGGVIRKTDVIFT